MNNQRFSGAWHNQYGSEIRFEVDESGSLKGKFRTNVGRNETRELWADTWFDVVGFVNGDLISFVINYHSIGTISAVSGRYVSKEKSKSEMNKIETVGYTSFNFSERDQWRSTAVTTNTYKPGPSPAF